MEYALQILHSFMRKKFATQTFFGKVMVLVISHWVLLHTQFLCIFFPEKALKEH